MEPQDRPDRLSNPPVVPPRPPAVPPGPDPWETGRRAPDAGQDQGQGRGPGPSLPPWVRRIRPRSIRGAVGLGLLGAALLLLPFLDDPDRWWIPIGLGFGTLVLLYLLRLDRVLFGWAPHVAGLVLVVALVWATSANPWAWGLAVGVGVVVAGLLLLPRWQVLAAGVVLLVVAGIGYQFRSTELADQQAQIDIQAGEQIRNVLGVERPQLAVVALDSGVADGNPRRVCRLVQEPALAQILQTTGATTCEQAVMVLHARSGNGLGTVSRPDRSADPEVAPGATILVDACSTAWGRAAGPPLGRVLLQRTDAPKVTYQVAGFRAC